MAGIKRYDYSALPSQNVTGVGIGPKLTGGVLTQELSVRIYVREKLPQNVVGRCALPTHFDGIPTDVVVCGPMRACHAVKEAARVQQRPVAPGASIGFAHSSRRVGGTLGAIVQRDGIQYYLSNNHVLAYEGKVPVGTPIVQPAMLDGGKAPEDQVGELIEAVALTSGANRVDAAIARVTDAVTAQPFYGVELSSTEPAPAVPL